MHSFWIGLVTGVLSSGVLIWLLTIPLIIDKWYVGTLNRDESIPNEPYYFMEIDEDKHEKLEKNKHVLLMVRKKNYLDDAK